MKIIETPVYEFSELSDKAKEKAREWFKESLWEDNFWSDCVIEDCTSIASPMGIDIEHIYFSGFSSQGDGACFVGKFRSEDVKIGKVKEFAPLDKELHKIAEEFEQIAKDYPTLYFETKHVGRYSHHKSVDYTFEHLDNNGNELPITKDIEEDVVSASERFMKWIYKQLENAWDFENSNKVVDENILSNGYTFTENGKPFGN